MVRVIPTRSSQVSDRGQLVLAAALVLVVALVPMVLAYLQLGYHGDVRSGLGGDPATDTEVVLDRSVHDASEGVAAEYRWEERSDAVRAVRDRLASPIRTLERSRLEAGVATAIRYDEGRARALAARNCPAGPDRQFGSCEASGGVVVQDRGGDTHVLAVAFEVTITTPDGRTQLRTLVEIDTG